MHASSTEDPGPPDILKQIGCILLESRIPSKDDDSRGYVEGPHYPDLSLGAPHQPPVHSCNPQENKQCRLVQQLEEAIAKGTKPLSCIDFHIHVYLTPPICCTARCDDRNGKQGWMLIESWSFRTFQNSIEKPFAISSLTLLHALRSFLHFTQLSSWLNRFKGKWNHGVEIVLSEEEVEWRPEHASSLIVHKFADCKLGDTVLSLCAKLLPKLGKIPNVICQLCGGRNPSSPFVTSLRPRVGITNYQVSSIQLEGQRLLHEQYIGNPFRPRGFYLEHIRHSMGDFERCISLAQQKPDGQNVEMDASSSLSPVEDGILIDQLTTSSTSSTYQIARRQHSSTPIAIPGTSQARNDVERLNARNKDEFRPESEHPELIERFLGPEKSPEPETEKKPSPKNVDPKLECHNNVLELIAEQNRGRDRTPRKRQASERSVNSRDRRRQAENGPRTQKTSRKLDLDSGVSQSVLTLLRNRVQISRSDLCEPGPSRNDVSVSTRMDDPVCHLPIGASSSVTSNSLETGLEKEADISVMGETKVHETEDAKDGASNWFGFCEKSRNASRNVPSAQERAKFRKYLDSSASMVFHTKNGLPLTSSPAPISRGDSFAFDQSINSVKAIRNALFVGHLPAPLSPVDITTSPVPYEPFRGLELRRHLRKAWRPSFSSNSLLGSFEESMLNGRLEPTSTVEGFKANLGASGLFCPAHREMPVSVFFYTLNTETEGFSPYLGHIHLGEKGYQVPREGTIQLTLFNPQGTVIKMFVVLYNLNEMPSNSKTFLRQRTYYMPSSAGEHNSNINRWLRYLVHLRFASTKSGRIFLHTDIRLIVIRKSDADTASGHELEKCYEWKSFTRGPTNPRFSPCL